MAFRSEDQFPRTSALPSQSPLFWVEQKDRYLRQLLVRDIEALTGRRLVTLFGNRFAQGSEIQAKDIAYANEVLGDCQGDAVDLLVETNGGETSATEAIVSLLRQTVSDYRVLVPNAAKSNGTLLAISASTILMGPPSELGPIEPHLGGVPVSTLILEDVKKQNLVMHIAGQQALRESQMLARQYLIMGMMSGKPEADVNSAVDALSTRALYASHGSVIDRTEAERLGLNVMRLETTDPLWNSIWLLYCMLDYDSRRSGLAKIFEGRSRSLSIAAPRMP